MTSPVTVSSSAPSGGSTSPVLSTNPCAKRNTPQFSIHNLVVSVILAGNLHQSRGHRLTDFGRLETE